MDVAVTSCLAATCGESALEAAEGSFELRQDLDLRRVLARLNGDATPLRRDAILGEACWFARRQLTRAHLLEPLRAVVTRLRVVSLWARGQAVAEDHLASQPLPPPYDGPHRLYDDEATDPRAAGMPALQAMLFTWFHGNILPTILRAIDRTSMAHGVEVRMPFSDWRLVTFAFVLPETKRALRQAMHGLTPKSILLGTRKIGIISLTESRSRGPLRSWLFDLTASRAFVESSVWNGSAARAAVERAVDGVASIGPVWPIINAYVLEQSFKAQAQNGAACGFIGIDRRYKT